MGRRATLWLVTATWIAVGCGGGEERPIDDVGESHNQQSHEVGGTDSDVEGPETDIGGPEEDTDAPDVPGPDLVDCDPVGAPFGGGSGAADDPFVVCTAAQLDAIRDHSQNSFRLAADIDLAGVEWTPIGLLSGNFHGGGHVIRNLRREVTGAEEVFGGFATQIVAEVFEEVTFENLRVTAPGRAIGLSAHTDIEILRDVHVTNGYVSSTDPAFHPPSMSAVGMFQAFNGEAVDVSFEGTVRSASDTMSNGHSTVSRTALLFGSFGGQGRNITGRGLVDTATTSAIGGLFGELHGSVESCSFEGTIKAGGEFVGGIVGIIQNQGVLEGCTFRGDIEGTAERVGGIAGSASGFANDMHFLEGTIRRSFATGNVAGRGDVGGLVGFVQGGRIEHAYFEGSLASAGAIGGAVGTFIRWGTAGSLTHVWISAALDSPSANAGGLIHYNDPAVDDAWQLVWNTDLVSQSGFRNEGAGVRGLTEAQMKQSASWTGWPDTIWDIADGDFPRLK
jgi:hypothetical protein